MSGICPDTAKTGGIDCKDLLGERYVTTKESATFDHSTYCFTNTEFFSVLLEPRLSHTAANLR